MSGGGPMIPLTVTMNLDLDPWTDMDRDDMELEAIERIGVLPNATHQGRACVEFLIRRNDGSTYVAETTLRLFRLAAAAVLASPTAQMEDM